MRNHFSEAYSMSNCESDFDAGGFHHIKFIYCVNIMGNASTVDVQHGAFVRQGIGGGGYIGGGQPIITHRETLKVINDLCKLLQMKNINE